MPEKQEPFEIWWRVGGRVVNHGNIYTVVAVHGEPGLHNETDHIELQVVNSEGRNMGKHRLSMFYPL